MSILILTLGLPCHKQMRIVHILMHKIIHTDDLKWKLAYSIFFLFSTSNLFLNGGSSNIAILVVLLLLFFMIETYFKEKSYKVLNQKNTFVRWTIYFGILAIIAFFGQFHSDAEFIYVNF